MGTILRKEEGRAPPLPNPQYLPIYVIPNPGNICENGFENIRLGKKKSNIRLGWFY